MTMNRRIMILKQRPLGSSSNRSITTELFSELSQTYRFASADLPATMGDLPPLVSCWSLLRQELGSQAQKFCLYIVKFRDYFAKLCLCYLHGLRRCNAVKAP